MSTLCAFSLRFALVLGLSWVTQAQNLAVDQASMRGTDESALFVGGTGGAFTPQQQVRAGRAGTLAGFEIRAGGPSVVFRLRRGTVPSSAPIEWEGTFSGNDATHFFDTSALDFQLSAGEPFAIEFELDSQSEGVYGSFTSPPCYPEPLFHPGGGFPDFRLVFRTFLQDLPAGQPYCLSQGNSTYFAARIWTQGSASLAANDLEWYAGPLPSTFGLFYYGAQPVQVPFGNGFRCVGGVLGRTVPMVPECGTLIQAIDWSALNPAVAVPGVTFHAQAWFRDPFGGGGSFTFDFSDAISIDVEP